MWVYSYDEPIGRRKCGYILTMSQSGGTGRATVERRTRPYQILEYLVRRVLRFRLVCEFVVKGHFTVLLVLLFLRSSVDAKGYMVGH